MLDGLVPPAFVVLTGALLLMARRVAIDRSGIGWRFDLALGVAIVLATVGLELAMGRHATYANGPIRLWVGDVNSDQNSQQLADPYTFSRAATIALGYYGDSVLNSFSDIASCLLGFALANRFRWWWTVSWIVATELVLALTIRDNLTLNIVMLIWPIEAVRRWQLGA